MSTVKAVFNIDELRTKALQALAQAQAEQRVLAVKTSGGFGSWGLIFKGKDEAETLASYLQAMRALQPADSTADSYSAAVEFSWGRVSKAQEQDLAFVSLDARSLMPGDVLYCTNEDGRSPLNLPYARRTVTRWVGDEAQSLMPFLQEGSFDNDRFLLELGIFAATRFLKKAQIDVAQVPEAAEMESAFKTLFPGVKSEYPVIGWELCAQTLERSGNTEKARTWRQFASVHNAALTTSNKDLGPASAPQP